MYSVVGMKSEFKHLEYFQTTADFSLEQFSKYWIWGGLICNCCPKTIVSYLVAFSYAKIVMFSPQDITNIIPPYVPLPGYNPTHFHWQLCVIPVGNVAIHIHLEIIDSISSGTKIVSRFVLMKGVTRVNEENCFVTSCVS